MRRLLVKTSNGILMIEPSSKASDTPVIDDLTRKMTTAWRQRRSSGEEYYYKGVHHCVCGAWSDNQDHWVGEGVGDLTNSLCVHYLAFHRDDISQDELDKVRALNCAGDEPDEKELCSPK